MPEGGKPLCTFCEIVAGREPATIRYQDEEVIVIDNLLHYAPVMLLVIPRKHLGQVEMWRNNMSHMAQVSMEVAEALCPNGFRIISNFGWDGRQTQPHGHLHILGGTDLGLYA